MNEANQKPGTSRVLRLIEILIGILAITIGIITLYPFRFFGIPTGVLILFLSLVILSVTLL